MTLPTWDILIPTLDRRRDLFTKLVDHLGAQILPGVGLIACSDNYERSIGQKRQELQEASGAAYVNYIDDDDMVPHDYIPVVRDALRAQPDVVGFIWKYYEGEDMRIAYRHGTTVHSIAFGERPLDTTFQTWPLGTSSPIKRELSLRAPFTGHAEEDFRRMEKLMELGCLQKEVFLRRELYHARRIPPGFHEPMPLTQEDVDALGPLPERPFLRYI